MCDAVFGRGEYRPEHERQLVNIEGNRQRKSDKCQTLAAGVLMFSRGSQGPAPETARHSGNLNGLAFTAFLIRPLRMHCTHTFMALAPPPSCWTRTFCKLGRNCRRVIPVIFVPTPPRYFALPRVSTELPLDGFLPQTSHMRAMNAPDTIKIAECWCFSNSTVYQSKMV